MADQIKLVHVDDLPKDKDGRFGDEYTVHVNKQELQQLAGPTNGYLTVNPKTGKPEAFLQFLIPLLADLLAPAASSGLTAMGMGGLASTLGNAGIGAALGGLGTYAATKDPLQALLGGVGGYFGAGPLSKLLGGGSSAAAAATGTAAGGAVSPLALSAAEDLPVPLLPKVGDLAAAAAAPGALDLGTSAALGAAPTIAGAGSLASVAPDALTNAAGQATALAAPSVISPAAAAAAKGGMMGMLKNPLVLGGLAMGVGALGQTTSKGPPPEDPAVAAYQQNALNLAMNPGPPTPYTYDPVGSTVGYGQEPEHNFFPTGYGYARGGAVRGGFTPNGIMGGPPGQMMQGPGDGSSDSIPAAVDGSQPAKLSSGEFVVPSDAVSHLGNGSSNAGAQRLHQMVQQVRMAKTGTGKMPQRV